jgi:glycosyltransferase involved in cell wall biosynthesis
MSFYTYYDRAGYDGEKAEQGNVLEKCMLESADHVICVTEFAQRAVINFRKIPLSKTSVIYNGKRLQNETPGDPESLKTRYGFSPGDRLILYAGKLEPRKGVDSLIRAFFKIAGKFQSVKLVIAGTGEYDSYFPLAQDCPGRICFIGKLKKETLWEFYKFSEIGVIPSRYEQCSYVAIEMMQAELLLIVSDVPGLNELIEHDKTGIICKVATNADTPGTIEADEDDLVFQMEYLLKNRTKGLKLAKKAYFQALERHSITNMGESTIKIYRQLINN